MKIIMALAGLDIGGAETHVVELSKEIKRRGFEVVMISGGGVYQKEVEDFGIKHYTVPVKARNYSQIIKAKGMIKKIIRDEKPDIVHAHARIPGFIIGLLHKEMHRSFVFVTTAHWTFDTSFVVKKLTCWGDKTLAVSEDIKKYLLKYYNVDEKNIFISINGIDSGKFNKDVSGEKIIKEFGLNPNAKRIVYVSRLNPAVCAPAFGIIEKIEKINDAVPGVEAVIVGDGDSYAEMKAAADEANKKLGRNAVILTGGRVDINEIHATADVCVGVSRAVLEPMAMEKRCVVAGQEGYIGILDETKLEEARDCNFTCRGCKKLDFDVLSDDIIKLFKMDSDEAKKVTDYGKMVVDTYYSVKTMADDNIKMYYSALRDMRHDAVMLGYYGYGNRGDDALLGAVLKDLTELSETFSPVVLSHNPEKTGEAYGVASIDRFNIIKIKKAMKNAKMLIAGGGSLIQDITSTKSIMYYLYIIQLAKRMGLKVMLYANGIGPVNKSRNRKKVSKVLNSVDVITLRDRESSRLLKELGVTKPRIEITADPVFSLNDFDTESAKKILSEHNINGKYICVSVRNFADTDTDFVRSFSKMVDYICTRYDCTPVFLPMQYEKDKSISLEVIKSMDKKGIFVDRPMSVSEIMGVISLADAAVAVRLHMLIFATAAGVPVLGINYDPKVRSFQNTVGFEFCIEPAHIISGEYKKTIDKFMSEREEIRKKTKEILPGLKNKAKDNAKIAMNLISGEDSK